MWRDHADGDAMQYADADADADPEAADADDMMLVLIRANIYAVTCNAVQL